MDNGISKKKASLNKMCISAVLLSLGLVIKLSTSVILPIVGAAGLKVDLSGIFLSFPALLFGPWYGGTVMALADILGAIIKPQGAYLPLLTLTQFFCGFAIGWLSRWILSTDFKKNKTIIIRIVALVLLAFILFFSISTHISLKNDGIISNIIPSQNELGKKAEVEGKEKNFFSSLICSLAKYTSDTLTINKIAYKEDTDTIFIPPTAKDSDGTECKVNRISADVFADINSVKSIYIPKNIQTIEKSALDRLKNATVYTDSESILKSAKESGIACLLLSSEEFNGAYPSTSSLSFEFTSSDSYRQTLHGYIIFSTIVLEIISALTIIIVLIGKLIVRKNEIYLRMLCVIFIPRFIVTTINTEILRSALVAWNNRSFLLLWVPRAIEEIIGCILLSYVISVLYSILITKISPALRKKQG